MRKHSETDEKPIYDLPYWGKIAYLRRHFEIN